tara:strand:+ start:58485 stop:58721 length:237 start_codon:yes stop_codon:yes gene_type:complete
MKCLEPENINMDIFSKESVFTSQTPFKEVARGILCGIFALPILVILSKGVFDKFLETISLLKLVDKGEIFFSTRQDNL